MQEVAFSDGGFDIDGLLNSSSVNNDDEDDRENNWNNGGAIDSSD